MKYIIASITSLLIVGCATKSTHQVGATTEKIMHSDQASQASKEIAYAGKAAVNSSSISNVGVKVMNPQELSECAQTLISAADGSQRLRTQNETLRNKKLEFNRRENLLESKRRTVDLRSKKQVDDYNKQLSDIRQEMHSFNQSVEEYNRNIQDINNLNNKFNVQCANRPYRTIDLAILSQREKLLMEKGATPFDLPVYSDDPTSQHLDPSWPYRPHNYP